MARLYGAQKLILQAILDSPTDPAGYVIDVQVAQVTGITIDDVQDWINTLDDEGYVDVARTTGGIKASIRPKGRLELRAALAQYPQKVLEQGSHEPSIPPDAPQTLSKGVAPPPNQPPQKDTSRRHDNSNQNKGGEPSQAFPQMLSEEAVKANNTESEAKQTKELARDLEIYRHAEELIGQNPDPMMIGEWLRDRLKSAMRLENDAKQNYNKCSVIEYQSRKKRNEHWEFIVSEGKSATKYDHQRQANYESEYLAAKNASKDAGYSLAQLRARRQAIEQAINIGYNGLTEAYSTKPQYVGITVPFSDVFRYFLVCKEAEAGRKIAIDFTAAMVWRLFKFVLTFILAIAFVYYCISYFKWLGPLTSVVKEPKIIKTSWISILHTLFVCSVYIAFSIQMVRLSVGFYREDVPGLAFITFSLGLASSIVCFLLGYYWGFQAITSQTYQRPTWEMLRDALGFSIFGVIFVAILVIWLVWESMVDLYDLRFWKPEKL